MKIGKLYQPKKFYWMLYPSKEITAAAIGTTAANAAQAAYFSKQLNCNVSYIEPNSIFCLLEQNGKFIKILSTNGEIGWIVLAEWCKNDIEEVNQ